MDKQSICIQVLCIFSVFLASVQGTCDQTAAQQCSADFTASLGAVSQSGDTTEFCQSALATLDTCISSVTDTCSQTLKDEFQTLVSASEASKDMICGGGGMNDPNMKCYVVLASQCNMPGEDFGALSEMLTNPQSTANQEESCRAVKEANLEQVKTCLTDNNCADVNVFGPQASQDVPTITFGDFIDLIEGLCGPDCTDYQATNRQVLNCMPAEEGDPTCPQLQEQFVCVREKLGSCQVMRTFFDHFLTTSGELTQLQQRCPDVDFSLEEDSGEDGDPDSAGSLSSLLAAILPLTLAALLR